LKFDAGELALEWLEENKGETYQNFLKKIMEEAHLNGVDYTKKLMDQKVYSKATITLLVPRIKQDKEKYIAHKFTRKGGFTNGQLFHDLATSLDIFTGGFSLEWFHTLKHLQKQKEGVYKVIYEVNL
jgi:L-2-hydroxyglutarate oxidase LhgO